MANLKMSLRLITLCLVILRIKACTENEYTCPGSMECIPKSDCTSMTMNECTLKFCENVWVELLPSAVEDLAVVNITHNSAMVSWEADQQADTYVLILDRPNGMTKRYSTGDSSYPITGLEGDTSYTLSVKSKNTLGSSDEVTKKFKTKRMGFSGNNHMNYIVAPSTVLYANVKEIFEDDVLTFIFSWQPPQDNGMDPENDDQPISYEVEHCVYRSTCQSNVTMETSVRVSDVSTKRMYTFSVSAINTAEQRGAITQIVYRSRNTREETSSGNLSKAFPTWIFLTLIISALTL